MKKFKNFSLQALALFLIFSLSTIGAYAQNTDILKNDTDIYNWGIENQKREEQGLEPLPLPGKIIIKKEDKELDKENYMLAEKKDLLAKQLQQAEISRDTNKYNKILAQYENNNVNSIGLKAVLPSGTTYINTPFYQQANSYYCGVASTQMALAAKSCYVTPWGSKITQSLLANNNYLETDAYGYTIGRYIKYTLNEILQTSFYVYKEVNSIDTAELVRRVRLDHTASYVPIVAVYQPERSKEVLEGHTNDYLRHFIPISACYGDPSTPQNCKISYKDPISGYKGRFINVPQAGRIPAPTMAWLINGGSIVY